MAGISAITFVDAYRGELDRGWNPADAASVLEDAGVPYSLVRVGSAADLEQAVLAGSNSAFWPLDYTFDPNPSGPTLVGALDHLGARYVGCNPSGARLTSKLLFKDALADAGLATPSWLELLPTTRAVAGSGFPAYAKTEFTCDSVGVRRAADTTELARHVSELADLFGHRIYLEAELDSEEWTVGCVVVGEAVVAAGLRFMPREAAYVDAKAKANNAYIDFGVPSHRDSQRLRAYVVDMAAALGLSGYFRVDLVAGADGALHAIDLNLLPCLNADPAHLSYLPMAFMRNEPCDYVDVLGLVLASISGGAHQFSPETPLAELVMSSRLLPATEVRNG